MAIYTLSINYIDWVKENKSHLLNVFFKFPNPECVHKAAIDKSNRLLDHYSKSAKENNDLFTWLDYMSRDPSCFEKIDIDIPENTLEEEMYLMIAFATKPNSKIIVCSHQYWKNHCYLNKCNKILYKNNEIEILDKDEAYQELNPEEKITQNISIINNNMVKKNNPWPSGSFYLISVLILIIAIVTSTIYVDLIVIPFVIIGSILLIGVIGALQLKNDDKLKDENFVKLMTETYKRIPLLKQGKEK